MNPEEKNPKAPEPEKVPIKSLRTYQGDVDEILSKGKASATTILIAEQKRKETKEPPSIKSHVDSKVRNKFFMILGSSLLFVGIIGVSVVYFMKSTESVQIEQKTKALISYAEEKKIVLETLSRDQLVTKIQTENNNFKLPPNSVLYLNTLGADLKEAEVSVLLKLLAPRMPAALTRSFENKYMLGIYSFDQNEPFIILTTKDFPSSFSGMQKWEKDMALDLQQAFQIPSDQIREGNLFEDEALKNKDLRILRDSNKNILLLYSFIDKNTLVITGSENVFTAIVGKYIINKQTE